MTFLGVAVFDGVFKVAFTMLFKLLAFASMIFSYLNPTSSGTKYAFSNTTTEFSGNDSVSIFSSKLSM